MESKFLRPNADHSPCIEQDDANRYSVEHCLCGKAEAFLDLPESKDAYGLSSYAYDEEICEVESVVCNDRILQGADHGDGSIKRVTEEEVTWGVVVSIALLSRCSLLFGVCKLEVRISSRSFQDG